MKSSFLYAAQLRWVAIVACIFMFCGARALAADLKLEAQLIWATDQERSPDPRHKPAQPWVVRKLRSYPFKWNYYFEVNRKVFTVAPDDTAIVPMSTHCTISVRNLGGDVIELSLSGRGKPVGRIKQSVPKGQLMVVGGDAENMTAWFVVLRQVD